MAGDKDMKCNLAGRFRGEMIGAWRNYDGFRGARLLQGLGVEVIPAAETASSRVTSTLGKRARQHREHNETK
jgi:hypothetical protein